MQVSDSVHLKYARWGQRDRAYARKEALGGGEAMALSRRGKGDCFQCARGARGVGPTYLHKRGHSYLFWVMGDGP